MRVMRLLFMATLIGAAFGSQNAFASAFQFYELGTPIIGTADVGQAVVANDASTTYFNPAGMTQLQGDHFMVGSQIMLPYNYFSQSSRTTISGGDNGGGAGTLTPGIGLYYVYSYAPRLKFGVSLNSPYGGALTYNDGWVGRYFVQNNLFYTLNLNPSVAYQINNWAAVGAGVAVEYANFQQTIALPLEPDIDGQINIKTDNWSGGFNMGMLFHPWQATQFGIAYRSRIIHNLHGDLTFLRITNVPSASTKMVMPQNIVMSFSQGVTSQFRLLGEAGWSNWATMKNTVIHVAGFSATTPRNWNNTYRFGLAAQYQAMPALLVQTGASYDSSPTTSSRRLPDLPMDRQIRVGAGVIYSMFRAARLGLSYEYINLGHANINNLSSNGSLVGSYARNYANVVQASIDIGC